MADIGKPEREIEIVPETQPLIAPSEPAPATEPAPAPETQPEEVPA